MEMNPTPLVRIHIDGKKKYATLLIIIYEFRRWVERKLNNTLHG